MLSPVTVTVNPSQKTSIRPNEYVSIQSLITRIGRYVGPFWILGCFPSNDKMTKFGIFCIPFLFLTTMVVEIDGTLVEDWTTRCCRLVSRSRIFVEDGHIAFKAFVAAVQGSVRHEYRTEEQSGVRVNVCLVLIPYVDAWVPLEVVLFATSAAIFRIYMAVRNWTERRRQCFDQKQKQNPDDPKKTPTKTKPPAFWSPPKQTAAMYDTIVKATVIDDTRYKDQGLQQTIEECKDVKTKLRKVEVDPDVARKEKRKAIRKKQLLESLVGGRTATKLSSASSSTSSLSTTATLSPSSSTSSTTTTFSISPESLQRARRFLGRQSTSSASTSTSVLSSGPKKEMHGGFLSSTCETSETRGHETIVK